MEPKPSRLPRRITVQPSPSSPISARLLRTSRLGGHTETYRVRDSSLRNASDVQDSSPLRTQSRDWTSRERDSLEHSWKTPTPTYPRCPGTIDLPLSGSYLANRSRISTASSSSSSLPSWYDPVERSQSTYSGLHSQQQDWDSKRPKLSYSGRAPLSGVRSTASSYTSNPDTSSTYGRFPRTTLFNADSRSERERERRTDSSTNGLMDYGQRNGDSTPSYLQDRVTSYAQGARPKENSLSTVQLNTSINRQLPSQSSSLLRDSSRNSRPVTSRDLRSPQRDCSVDFRHTSRRNEGTARTPTSGRVSPAPQRSTGEQTTDTEGRRTTRHLFSRLASSMSSTFFSRRSSQDSLSGRSTEAEEAHSSLHRSPPPPVATTPANTDAPETRPSEQSQGFAFLRRRRWGLSSMSPIQSSDSDAESYRSEDSDTRTSASWLPSSLRNRCTPLFSRRRREGREEPFRASSTSDSSSIHSLLRQAPQEDSSLDEVRPIQGAGATADHPTLRSSDSVGGSAQAASLAESLFSRRNSGISGMLPNSFLHFSVPAALGNSLSDNVMITVDIVPSGRTSDGQESEKPGGSRDPEKLKKIKESLLLEDSEEEDDDLCRICQTGVTTATNPFIEPCKCSGSLQYVHRDCMKKWLHAKINSGSNLETITTCELCKEKLNLNFADFNIQELYRAHANERAEYEFISSGLYLVVLLHLCEQRFSDMLESANETNTRVRFINLARTLQAHMEDLETSEDDSEDERV